MTVMVTTTETPLLPVALAVVSAPLPARVRVGGHAVQASEVPARGCRHSGGRSR
jgi:hypothetical protein